jgi:hypothetical protein
MADLPIACALDPEALKTRREGLLTRLVRRATERQELPDGVRLRFTADSGLLGDIAEVVNAERLCCRFLRFTISVRPDEGPITLDLTGPLGTREFIGAILDVP